MGVAGSDESGARVEQFRGAELGHRLKPDAYRPEDQEARPEPVQAGSVSLAPATQIEIVESNVRFWVGFTGSRPDEHWLRAFRDAPDAWPPHLCKPLLEEDRGIWFGPLPIGQLEEHVGALKRRVAGANDTYAREVVPELRRRREEALRREQERRQVWADVETRLKSLLG